MICECIIEYLNYTSAVNVWIRRVQTFQLLCQDSVQKFNAVLDLGYIYESQAIASQKFRFTKSNALEPVFILEKNTVYCQIFEAHIFRWLVFKNISRSKACSISHAWWIENFAELNFCHSWRIRENWKIMRLENLPPYGNYIFKHVLNKRSSYQSRRHNIAMSIPAKFPC